MEMDRGRHRKRKAGAGYWAEKGSLKNGDGETDREGGRKI